MRRMKEGRGFGRGRWKRKSEMAEEDQMDICPEFQYRNCILHMLHTHAKDN